MSTETDVMAEQIFQSVTAYVDRKIRAATTEREAELLTMLNVMQLRLEGLSHQSERHKEHLSALEKKYRALHV